MFDLILQRGVLLVILVTGLPLIAGAVTGFGVAIVQAATQIQDQSISYLLKMVAAGGVLFFCSRWLWTQLVEYSEQLFSMIAMMGNMP